MHEETVVKKMKFGDLKISERFWWNGTYFQKIDYHLAKIVRNDRTTERWVEFATSVTIEIDD